MNADEDDPINLTVYLGSYIEQLGDLMEALA